VNDHRYCVYTADLKSLSYQRLRIQYDKFLPVPLENCDCVEDHAQSE
jgi:hypothetical protein